MKTTNFRTVEELTLDVNAPAVTPTKVQNDKIVRALKKLSVTDPDEFHDSQANREAVDGDSSRSPPRLVRVLAARNRKPRGFFWPIGPIILFPVTTMHFLTNPANPGTREWEKCACWVLFRRAQFRFCYGGMCLVLSDDPKICSDRGVCNSRQYQGPISDTARFLSGFGTWESGAGLVRRKGK
jgi:hypothetical protein